MTTWRMAFRCGTGGESVWKKCKELGVAAISYDCLDPFDLSKHPMGTLEHLWKKLSTSQHASLRRVAYEMKKGDVIYVKEGVEIVGRGVVTGGYRHVPKGKMAVVPESETVFPHQVPVAWDKEFCPVNIKLGAELYTVLELNNKHLKRLERACRGTIKKAVSLERELQASEGGQYKAEVTFRKRNQGLIASKKAQSDGLCEVCGFDFGKKYDHLDREPTNCLVAHHLQPIGKRKRNSKTTLDDIALLCPNCHTAVHTEDPPITVEKLKARLTTSRVNNKT